MIEPRKEKYRLLLEHLPDAFAFHQIITDDSGDAVDYIFLDMNAAFEKMTGLPRDKVIGRKVTEVLPGIEDSDFDWIGAYGRVALDGETATFEQYSEPLDCWYEVTAYSDEPGYFAVLFRDVTSSKKEKLALELLLKATQQSIQKTIGEIDYQHLTDALLQLSGAKFVAINTYEEKETKTVTRAISGIADSIRKASELIGFELTGKAWDVIPARINSIKDGRLLEFKNLYESGSGAISKQVAYLLEKVIGLGKVYVKEIAYHGQSVGDFIIFMPQGKTIQNQNLVEVFTNQAGATLLRNKAEQALKEKREQQEILLDNIETQIWFLKDVENYGSVNQAHADFFGVQKEELENKSLYDLTATREEAEICIADNQEVFRQKHQIHSEELVLNGKGEQRLLSITKTPKLNDHNNVEYVVCSAEDITERKQAEAALSMQNTLIKTQQEVSLDGILVVDADDKIVSFNQRFADIWEIPDDIMALQSGDKALQFVLPKLVDPEEFENRINYLSKNRQEKSHEEIALVDGRMLERYSAPMFNHDGHYYGRVWYYRDITARKQAEKKIHDYTMELELKGVELEKLYQQLDQELEKARSIHERTLPKSNPELEGLSVHAFYQPAQRMGGDFYNAIQVNDKLILYLSDVSGHGLEGALLSSFIKEAIDSYASLKPDEIEPEKILYHLNRQYRRENYPEDYFVCIFLMVLDLNSMELAYTGAGFQELPLVQMGTGERLRLYTEGPPISSAIPEEIMDFTTAKIILSPGTTVLVNTDGITEQQSGGVHYNGRLEQVFYEHSHLAPELIMKAIKKDFCRFNGGSMQGEDDITLGIIQVEPEGTRKINL